MKKKPTVFLVESGLIGAVYATLTILATVFAPYLTYGTPQFLVQFRVSEALTILPLFTPAAIPGLFVGCIISNIYGVAAGANIAGAWDILFGSVATLLAAILTRWLKDVKFKGIPFLALLPPVILNAVIVGLELSIYIPDISLLLGILSVGVGEFVVCYGLGIPLYLALIKTKLFK